MTTDQHDGGETRALAPRRPDEVALGTVRAATPSGLVSAASTAATTLASVIRDRGLAVKIQGREYVRVEGWTTLATMLGAMPQEVAVEALDDGRRYVATVELVRMSDGRVLSRASAECGADEKRWSDAPRYARRSMAVTRATSKACRLAFSWVMALAGYETTPAEEVVDIVPSPPAGTRQPKRRQRPGAITAAQRKRLWTKAYEEGKAAGYTEDGVKDVVSAILEERGLQSTSDIPKERYDEIIEAITNRLKARATQPVEAEVIPDQDDENEF